MRSDDAVAQVIRAAGAVIALASTGWGLYVLGVQSYHFLHLGEWAEIGALTYLGGVFRWEWATYPETWRGLHRILNYLNAGFAILGAGLLAGSLLFNFERES